MNHLIEIEDQRQDLYDEVIAGFSESPKSLPCKLFYDQRGSELFNEICELDEYYLTRAEVQIMQRYAAEMGRQIGEQVRLVEYGSGSSTKTRILLDHLQSPVAYVPVDISRQHLLDTARQLRLDYPEVEVLPVVADFTQPISLPTPDAHHSHTAVYFPGSTIGNLEPHDALALLKNIASQCGQGGGLLIGIDLVKDVDVLERAYNDSAGVTSEFNLNLLHRIQNELGAKVDLTGYEHDSFYNQELARIEIYIRSQADQSIEIGGYQFSIGHGERIHTEYSHKYTIEGFARLAADAGFALRKSWQDEHKYFAVLHLVVDSDPDE